MADRDKGKEKALEPLEGTNIFHFKRKKIENTSDGQKKEGILEIMERGWKKIEEENRLREMKMDAEAARNKESEGTEATIDIEALDGIETEDTTEESDQEEEKTVLSPKESSTNNPKGMKKKKMNVELAAGNNQDEELILSPKESSTNNPKGMKMKRVREEEEEDEEDDQEDKEKKLKAADSLSDACTGKFPTSPPIDKFMDSDKMRSPPGDL